ncbi:MAG: pseudouridylate synthase [Fusobacteriaceae bacterium]
MTINFRALEKSDKLGFLFFIAYNGIKFHAFDELKGKNTVKGEFSRIMNELEFTWAKGIQQGGRTDAKVSADENILYLSSRYFGDLDELKKNFNKLSPYVKIKKIVKTLPNLAFPDMVEGREYIYSYPKKRITLSLEEIEERCRKYSGTYDVSIFTDHKGKELKEHMRTVEVRYTDGKLYFRGDSFMPKQVRIMSAYLLTDSMDPLPGKYLKLDKICVKKDLEDMYIDKNKKNWMDSYPDILQWEMLGDINIVYLKKEKKSEFIGKNGNNINKFKKLHGNTIVREI